MPIPLQGDSAQDFLTNNEDPKSNCACQNTPDCICRTTDIEKMDWILAQIETAF